MTILSVLANIFTIVGGFAVVLALVQYWSNSRLERARWLASLYEKFYEKDDLKRVREIVDCDPAESTEVGRLVTEEPSGFTDYLNFFEFVAILEKSRQLRPNEIEDLFRYYLDCLETNKQVRDYIATKGYEHLDKLLRRRRERK